MSVWREAFLARLDLQLLAMVDDARASLGAEDVQTDERFLLQGYSASGMFANRFTALHPDRVMAVASGSPGGWPIAPAAEHQGERLPYPAGVADVEAVDHRQQLYNLALDTGLFGNLFHRHLSRRIPDIGPPRRVQPDAAIRPLHE